MTAKEMKKSSDEYSPPTSFDSLPKDIILDCLARVSTFYRPTLSLLSKYFQSLIASPDLEAIRSHRKITETYLYVCLDLNRNKPNPLWFTLSTIPNQQRLKPIPMCPDHQHLKCSTVLSMGSKIYIIGGFVDGMRSKVVLMLDCRSHQWRRLTDMHHHRATPAADVIDGKIYVIGGCKYNDRENWGEVYDPQTQTWEPILRTTLDLTTQKRVVPGLLVMGGKVYNIDSLMRNVVMNVCLVEIDNMLCQISISQGTLYWCDTKENLGWVKVIGLGVLPNYPFLTSLANSDGGRRVTVWWDTVVLTPLSSKKCTTEIWCAEISFKRRCGLSRQLWGVVEWCNLVFTFDGCNSSPNFFSHSAIVTY